MWVGRIAQRRPGREPRRHAPVPGRQPHVCAAQRRPGREPRRHPVRVREGRIRPRTLNEGRGANPGDTSPDRRCATRFATRSTKAGARTPATLAYDAIGALRRVFAQRRPGREPRRHQPIRPRSPTAHASLNEGRGANPGDTSALTGRLTRSSIRSTKAGARTPATRRAEPLPARPRYALNEGRGANPGDTPRRRPLPPLCPALNEGRGANPGDTGSRRPALSTWTDAQRRPGREPRRHWLRPWRPWAGPSTLNEGRGANPGDTSSPSRPSTSPRPLNEGRGANPGDTGSRTHAHSITPHAQRRPGREPRRHAPGDEVRLAVERRSTKAGARTPATPARASRRRGSRSALNEGRGANPGDTSSATRSAMCAASAQRRPGREPRRHAGPNAASAVSCVAQRRPGREPRRHLNTTSAAAPPRRAQRRPGREPRRHFPRCRVSDRLSRRSTKAGARTPATRPASPCSIRRRTPLNEGRGANPGDTFWDGVYGAAVGAAQRRPGREPRRHAVGAIWRIMAPFIAQRRPGREPRRHPRLRNSVRVTRFGAQRRPGREPRRHFRDDLFGRVPFAAQRRPGREPRRHSPPAVRCRSAAALNEGRGANPGDTCHPAR